MEPTSKMESVNYHDFCHEIPDDLAEVVKLSSTISSKWADDMEERGLPGHAILKDYMDIMRANNQPIVRHWDRE